MASGHATNAVDNYGQVLILLIPHLASFGPGCLGVAASIPLWFSLLVLLGRYALRPLWRRRPPWLRSFAAEDGPEYTLLVGEDQQPNPFDRGARRRPWTASATALLCISVAGAVSSLLISLLFDYEALFLTAFVPCLVSCIILTLDRPRSTPGAIILVHGSLLAAQLALLLAVPKLLGWPHGVLAFGQLAIPVCSLALILAMPMRELPADDKEICPPFEKPSWYRRSPEDNFTLWHWMTVTWMSPLISTAYKRQLHDEDVWLLPFQFQHDRLHRLFREVQGSVVLRLVKANAPDMIITASLGMLESVATLLPVVLLKQLLAAQSQPTPAVRVAVVYAILILVTNLVRTQSGIFSIWFSRRCYERSRGQMITMIYEKTVRRKAFTFPSRTPRQKEDGDSTESGESDDTGDGPASMGKILNLMRNDVYEVAQRFWEFPSMFTKPLNFVLSLVLLWRILGPSSLMGMLVVMLTQFVNFFVIRLLIRWEVARRAITDLKLQVTSQFIEAIRHLRWYDWQGKWLDDILAARQTELRYRIITGLLQRAIAILNQLAASFFPVAAFYAYTVISKQPLTVEVAFPALSLFTMLETSLRELPDLVTVLLNATVAMRRIESFMAEPNKEEDFHTDIVGLSGELRINIKEASFSWPGVESPVLTKVNLKCKTGLTVVCGKVGNGKTALLHAILGELDQHGGDKIVPQEMIGYTAQTPWLQSMSIRDNILFSADFDGPRYKQVVNACCLQPDLAEFKAHDLSMIGENGVGLSGGQRARVALARAVYSRARILLLDDPIAALDHDTAEKVLRRLFRTSGLMDGRLVVFVTHRVGLVSRYADQLLQVDNDGTVSELCGDDFDSQDIHRRSPVEEEEEDQHELMNGDAVNIEIPDKFIEEERRAHGGVVAAVYWRYVRAGKLRWWAALILCFVIYRTANIAYYYFLKEWGEGYQHGQTMVSLLLAPHGADGLPRPPPTSLWALNKGSSWWDNIDFGLPAPDVDVMPWLFWFMMLSIAQVIAQTLAGVVLITLTYTAGKSVFKEVLHRVSNATFRFFDVTPVGRLMNRVTSDIGVIDGQIAGQVMACALLSITWVSAMLVIASAAPIFLALAVVLTIVFVLIFLRFLPCSQSLRRLEMVSLSPLMSNFGTLLEGLTTVRAFRAQPHFQNRIIVTTDAFQKMDHFYWSLQSWLMYRFDTLSALSTFALTLTALATGLSSGAVAFVLTAAAGFVDTTHQLCRKYGELQMQFVSVERVIELLDLDTEPKGDIRPPAAWPTSNDDIVFDNLTIRYAPNLPPSLRGVSMRIPAGSTVAVTGRTGSGKSTLALALLGTILPDLSTPMTDGAPGTDTPDSGDIRIGAVSIRNVDKHALRRRISFVAQDPVLFPGTLRDNLDPVGEHSDEECEMVLKRVMMHGGGGNVHGNGNGGDFGIWSRVDAGGKNMSQGQRQLVGLGRAVLRRSPIVILDEATASIDMKTSLYIQDVLREELRYSTVITIAHRVEAVKDADFSIVLENGRVAHAGPVEGS